MSVSTTTKVVFIVSALILTSVPIIYKIVNSSGEGGSDLQNRSSGTELVNQAPDLSHRLPGEISTISAETFEQSVHNFIDVNFFYWPGPPPDEALVIKSSVDLIPLESTIGQSDLEAIMSNRRFRKILSDLSKMEPTALEVRIKSEIRDELSRYLVMYRDKYDNDSKNYNIQKLKNVESISAPSFVIEHPDNNHPTIAGSRLKLLALVWIAGMYKLESCRSDVEEIARLAVHQREELYLDELLHPLFKWQMLKSASIYNRQVLASSLLELRGLRDDNLGWISRDLSAFNSELTEYDLPVRSGVMTPDYSMGVVKVDFLPPLDDVQFNEIYQKGK